MGVSRDIALEALTHPGSILIVMGRAEDGKFFFNIRTTDEDHKTLLISRYPCHDTRESVIKRIQDFFEGCLCFKEDVSRREDQCPACLDQVLVNAIIDQLRCADRVDTRCFL